MDIAEYQRDLPGLPKFLGVTFTRVDKEIVTAELVVRPEHCNPAGTIHGGGIMTFADTLGAVGTWINLREGQDTTTIESKTNFFAAALVGTTLMAESVPLHRGRRTQVWETKLTRPDGRLVAKVTQTQLVL
ncbi:MAG: PaaI family thioesterase [Acetobacteraceae bacterium]|nr:PaaI family thioesterase [Acetobacteraceae bacterium]